MLGLFRREKTITVDLTGLAELDEADDQELGEKVRAELDAVTDRLAADVTHQLGEHLERQVKEIHKFRRQFESRLLDAWRAPLFIYDFAVSLSTEVGSDLNSHLRPRAAEANDLLFEVLTRLHGRACLTASEIGALLRSGHATGANARWRTLHELSVVAQFIAENGGDMPERYLAHDTVARKRVATQQAEFAHRLGLEAPDPKTLGELRDAVRDLRQKYGRGYESDYGWAAQVLGKERPKFQDIAVAVKLDHWAPYVRMASHGVHSGPRGAFFDIGLPSDLDAIPAGPSQLGLADPASSALISLMQVTVTLLQHAWTLAENRSDDIQHLKPGITHIAQMKLMQTLTDIGLEAFHHAHEDLESGPTKQTNAPRIFDKPLYEMMLD